MNWFLNFYFGEGPGISKDAPKPEGLRLLAHVLGREWWDLIKLNLLFITFALPIITLPAAYYATAHICIAMIEDKNVYLWRDFWSAMKARFWQVTLLGGLFFACCGLSYLALQSYAQAASSNLFFVAPLMIAVTVSVLLPLCAAHILVALLLGAKQPYRAIFKAAAIGFLARPLPGLFALVFVAILWIAHILFYPVSVLLPVLVNFSLGALVTSFAVRRGVQLGFEHIAADPQSKSQEDRHFNRRNFSIGGEHDYT